MFVRNKVVIIIDPPWTSCFPGEVAALLLASTRRSTNSEHNSASLSLKGRRKNLSKILVKNGPLNSKLDINRFKNERKKLGITKR